MLQERLSRIHPPVVNQQDSDIGGIPFGSRLESDRKRLGEEESKLKEAKNKLRENNQAGGSRYGIPMDLWDQLTQEQRSAFAGMYAKIDPISEGYREIKETHGDLSLSKPEE